VFDHDMIFSIPALLIALTIHEYAHARAAVSLGDPTPRYFGRLTLNPIPHLDPIGLIMLWLFKMGWAKPVPINPSNFYNWRKGTIITSLAGPLSNIAVALVTAFILRTFEVVGYQAADAIQMIGLNIYKYNLVFAIFNLLPFPPLDGSKVLTVFLPARYEIHLQQFEQYSPFILMIFVYLGVVWKIVEPLINLVHVFIQLLVNVVL